MDIVYLISYNACKANYIMVMEKRLKKKNEYKRTIDSYELTYKKFKAEVKIERGEMKWNMDIHDKKGNEIHATAGHFMSEHEIELTFKSVVNDCIRNPSEYYDF